MRIFFLLCACLVQGVVGAEMEVHDSVSSGLTLLAAVAAQQSNLLPVSGKRGEKRKGHQDYPKLEKRNFAGADIESTDQAKVIRAFFGPKPLIYLSDECQEGIITSLDLLVDRHCTIHLNENGKYQGTCQCRFRTRPQYVQEEGPRSQLASHILLNHCGLVASCIDKTCGFRTQDLAVLNTHNTTAHKDMCESCVGKVIQLGEFLGTNMNKLRLVLKD